MSGNNNYNRGYTNGYNTGYNTGYTNVSGSNSSSYSSNSNSGYVAGSNSYNNNNSSNSNSGSTGTGGSPYFDSNGQYIPSGRYHPSHSDDHFDKMMKHPSYYNSVLEHADKEYAARNNGRR